MPKKQVSSEKIAKPNGHFSQATVIEARGRMVFISGITARRPDGSIAGIGDIEAQTRQVCENVKAAVEAAGGTLANVCRVDVYVRKLRVKLEAALPDWRFIHTHFGFGYRLAAEHDRHSNNRFTAA